MPNYSIQSCNKFLSLISHGTCVMESAVNDNNLNWQSLWVLYGKNVEISCHISEEQSRCDWIL